LLHLLTAACGPSRHFKRKVLFGRCQMQSGRGIALTPVILNAIDP
jgi:hypothetical protein